MINSFLKNDYEHIIIFIVVFSRMIGGKNKTESQKQKKQSDIIRKWYIFFSSRLAKKSLNELKFIFTIKIP